MNDNTTLRFPRPDLPHVNPGIRLMPEIDSTPPDKLQNKGENFIKRIIHSIEPEEILLIGIIFLLLAEKENCDYILVAALVYLLIGFPFSFT